MFAISVSTSLLEPFVASPAFWGINIIVLSFVLFDREHWRKVRALAAALAVAGLLAVTVRGFDMASPCNDWDALESTYGYYLALYYWISWGC